MFQDLPLFNKLAITTHRSRIRVENILLDLLVDLLTGQLLGLGDQKDRPDSNGKRHQIHIATNERIGVCLMQ